MHLRQGGGPRGGPDNSKVTLRRLFEEELATDPTTTIAKLMEDVVVFRPRPELARLTRVLVRGDAAADTHKRRNEIIALVMNAGFSHEQAQHLLAKDEELIVTVPNFGEESLQLFKANNESYKHQQRHGIMSPIMLLLQGRMTLMHRPLWDDLQKLGFGALAEEVGCCKVFMPHAKRYWRNLIYYGGHRKQEPFGTSRVPFGRSPVAVCEDVDAAEDIDSWSLKEWHSSGTATLKQISIIILIFVTPICVVIILIILLGGRQRRGLQGKDVPATQYFPAFPRSRGVGGMGGEFAASMGVSNGMELQDGGVNPGMPMGRHADYLEQWNCIIEQELDAMLLELQQAEQAELMQQE